MIILITVAMVLTALILFFWWRRARPVRVQAVPEEYLQLLEENVRYYRRLEPQQKEAFARRVQTFLGRVHIEGVGTAVEEKDRVLVAASAIIPIFGFGDWKYPNLTNVILYPGTFNEEFQYEGEGRTLLGMVGSGYMNGQMILSLPALRAGFAHEDSTSNTPIHEFVHLLDKTDGSTDGIPEDLLEHSYVIPWLEMMHAEIQKISEGESDINPYAMTSDAEFFAVVSEYFFQQPQLLETNHPEIYGMLCKIFKQGR